jgi:hypothetical protein
MAEQARSRGHDAILRRAGGERCESELDALARRGEELEANLHRALVPAPGDPALLEWEAGRPRPGKGRQQELDERGVVGAPSERAPPTGRREQCGGARDRDERELVAQPEPAVVRRGLLGADAGELEQLPPSQLAGVAEGRLVGILRSAAADPQAVAGDERRNVRRLRREALHPALPDLATRASGQCKEVDRTSGPRVEPGGGVLLPPPVVVLGDGAQQLGAARVVEELGETGEGEDPGGQAGVLGLRHQDPVPPRGADDHAREDSGADRATRVE